MSTARRRFEGQVAVVTGAGRGMGRAVAEGLAGEGAQVVIAEIDQVVGAAAAEQIATTGGKAVFRQLDVGDVHQVERVFQEVVALCGSLDILVNSAGLIIAGPMVDYSAEDWKRQMATNLDGVFYCSQAAARAMIPKRRGKIVNFASTAAFVSTGSPAAAYCASKAGVRQLTVATAAELAPYSINVNAVAPGTILTDMSRASLDTADKMAREVAKIPIGRVGAPDDVAGPVLFLCSSESDFVTGHTLVVDGGWLLF